MSTPSIDAAEASIIMARIAAGDRAEFASFVQRFGPFVVGRALRITKDPGTAEDVAQNVLSNVWLKAGSFRSGRGNLMAWLQILTRNAAIDHLRREERQGRIAFALEKEVAPSGPDLLDAIERRQDREMVQRALGQLGEDQRIAIELAYMHGLTYVEVAARLGEPEGTVKSRIRRGLKQLSRLVGETNE